jgi:hypothetical protein
MADGEIVRRLVCDILVGVDERRVGIAENVGVGLVLHHDQEDMIELSERRLVLDRELIGIADARAQRSHSNGREELPGHSYPPVHV